ncbi:hypothetical protein BC828DRAFT_390770 [Blastocladiella britannica]|nr:hypothetical protein BC828DRAFT_390770 [Blastocladiella britannica]
MVVSDRLRPPPECAMAPPAQVGTGEYVSESDVGTVQVPVRAPSASVAHSSRPCSHCDPGCSFCTMTVTVVELAGSTSALIVYPRTVLLPPIPVAMADSGSKKRQSLLDSIISKRVRGRSVPVIEQIVKPSAYPCTWTTIKRMRIRARALVVCILA